jgi:hypothetical protein
MKRIILLSGILLLLVFTNQCKKSDSNQEKQLSISYPSTGNWGDNVLYIKDSTLIDPSKDFSFRANLQADAVLKVIMTNLSIAEKSGWFFDINSNDGWNITVYDNGSHQQIFTSRKAGVLDLDMTFIGPGKCKIDIYENNSITITKSITLLWN